MEIDDTFNSDGYVQIGRLFMSATWTRRSITPTGPNSDTRTRPRSRRPSRAPEYFDTRAKPREFSITLEGLTDTEAYDVVLALQRVSGISGEILQIPDLDDAARIPARAYVGRLVDMSPIKNPKPGRFTTQLKIGS